METNVLTEELAKAQQLKDSTRDTIGMLSIKSVNQAMKEASQRPNPMPLWLSLWYEGEACCLFADSNLGKSIYAVQIATHIATLMKVLYLDFELSDKQFQLRYTGDNGELFEFPNNLYRVDIDREHLSIGDFEAEIIDNIEQVIEASGANVLIIDNLTYLCTAAEKGDVAGSLMIKLLSLKRKYNLSILVIAHTPKRQLSNPITQNDLAGSKKLFNFFDSVFAIGKSAKDSNLRYIKQIKVRYGSYTNDADNVIVCTIEKTDSFLQFVQIGFGDEREHLRERSEDDINEEIKNIQLLVSKGNSYSTVAKELGISKSKVQRAMKK
ncbi:MAG: AAA family ATPase [Rikenellaceae bacterium]